MAQSGMEPMTVSVHIREGLALLVGVFAIVLLLALGSFSAGDLSKIEIDQSPTNLIGILGAYTSFGILWFFGSVAFLFPLSLFWISFTCIYDRKVEIHWPTVYLRAGSTFVLILPLAILAELHIRWFMNLPLGSGGFLGSVLAPIVVVLLHEVGATIVLLAVSLLALQVSLGFSWLNVFETTGKILYDVSYFLVRSFRRVNGFLASLVSKVSTLKLERAEVTKNKKAIELLSLKPTQERFEPVVPPVLPSVDFDRDTVDDADIAESYPVDLEPLVDIEPSIVEPKKGASRINVREHDILSPLPSIEILTTPSLDRVVMAQEKEALIALGERLREILADYRVTIEVESIISGPVVSRFEIQLAPGSKVAKIVSLANDLAREIAVRAVRVVPVIPGKTVVGIEIPNPVRATVGLREILECDEFQNARYPLMLALGKGIAGNPVFANLERMPHLLVAGTTGSGKSVGLNTMLLSMLYRLTPDDVRFIMIDPKMLELSVYEHIPHMLTPVVTDMQDAAKALQWSIGEMDRRYRLMKELQVRSLGGLNEKIEVAAKQGNPIMDPMWDPLSNEEQEVLEKLPLIVIVIDEFADMIMIVGKKVEQLIARIAQKARAAGIHLILATQRPSVDVITGLIKANIPCRISYQVSSQVDSRTILDQVGAEQLLGNGDMLYLPPGTSVPERVHGAFISDEEVLNVIEDWRSRGAPIYMDEIMAENTDFDPSAYGMSNGGDEADDLYTQAVTFVLDTKRASASALQTKFQIGWNKAARLMDQMESQGVVSVPDNNGRRQVLRSES